ncbi:MAG: hypothetical protein H7Y11_00580 [Armatimonadetes bacterium]|nr:hypothetical protein [Anaerolineae bacterium]
MFNRLDRSQFLSKLIDNLSNVVARQRGLPIVIGIGLVILSFVIQLLNVAVGSPLLDLLGVVALHVGVLTALIGSLLVNPLGG